jgi:periplasmic protein TonB
MASTTNESMPAEVSPGDAATAAAEGTSTLRMEAVGTEVPVVVHASRYSTATPNAAKRLAPVHEETHTVIVFPQGAVIRLSASVTAGEMVVLTNQRSGADVICRVAEVKTQPGIQSYVNLEFRQRAPGFWGDCFPEAGPSEHLSFPPAGAAPAPVDTPTGAQPTREKISAAPKLQEDAVSAMSAAAEPGAHLAPFPASIPTPAAEAVEKESTAGAPSPGIAKTGPAQPARMQESPKLLAPQFGVSESSSGSKKVLLIAAGVVLAIAVTGGAMLYRQESKPAPELSAASMPQNVTPQTEDSLPAEAASPEPAASAAAPLPADAAADTSEVNPVAPPAEPAPRRAASAPSTIATRAHAARRARFASAKLGAPLLKGRAAPLPSQPPAIPAASAGANLLAAVQDATAPASPAPVPGGQVQLPKLVSSPAPVYPDLARTDSVQGVVVIDALVDAQGRVSAMKVLSGPGILQRAAMDALRKWKYQPGRLNGQPIAMHTRVRVDFLLH